MAYYNLSEYARLSGEDATKSGLQDAPGLVRQAIEDFDEAIELDPAFANAYWLWGVTYQALGMISRAQEDFDKAHSTSHLPIDWRGRMIA